MIKTLFVSTVLGFSVSCLAQVMPALSVQYVEASDSEQYADFVKAANAAMRARHDVGLYLRAYETRAITGQHGELFLLSPAGTFEQLFDNERQFAKHSDLADLRRQLGTVNPTAPRFYLKAIRFDGTNTPGWLLNTWVICDQEDVLLAAARDLKVALPAGTDDPLMINVFRIVAGPATATHLMSFNFPSAAKLSATLDALTENGWPEMGTSEPAARLQIVSSAIFRELEGK